MSQKCLYFTPYCINHGYWLVQRYIKFVYEIITPSSLYPRSEYSLPEPGKSTDFGKRTVAGLDPGDPVYRELEERLFKLAHNSRDGSIPGKSAGGDGGGGGPSTISRSIQTSLTDISNMGQRVYTVSAGTQMSPEPRRSHPPVSTATTTTTETSTDLSSAAPLPHIEANIVNIKVLGLSSEDSSIPSSYEKVCKLCVKLLSTFED